jgi:hypothetical protein
MPDFDQLAHNAKVSAVDCPESARMRATGRRWRALAAATVLAVAGVLLLPRAPAATSPAPSQRLASDTPSQVTETISPSALLPASDFGSGFSPSGKGSAGLALPNPFLGCGPDGLPGGYLPVVSLGMSTYRGQAPNGSQGSETVLRFASGDAHRAMVAIDALVAGSCVGHYQVVGRALGGDESLLLYSADQSVVAAEYIHGKEMYYAIVRKGNYLMWIALTNSSQANEQAAHATTLAQRTLQSLCSTVVC